jgi:hypothetical protein
MDLKQTKPTRLKSGPLRIACLHSGKQGADFSLVCVYKAKRYYSVGKFTINLLRV